MFVDAVQEHSFNLAIPVDPVTVEQSRHLCVPNTGRYPEARAQRVHDAELDALEQGICVLVDTEV